MLSFRPAISAQVSTGVDTGVWSQSTSLIGSSIASDIAQRQPLRYAGYCYDQESGMYYLSARYYDPGTRQFLSKDILKADGEESAYQYCLGDPVENVDPSGLAPWNYRTVRYKYLSEKTCMSNTANWIKWYVTGWVSTVTSGLATLAVGPAGSILGVAAGMYVKINLKSLCKGGIFIQLQVRYLTPSLRVIMDGRVVAKTSLL